MGKRRIPNAKMMQNNVFLSRNWPEEGIAFMAFPFCRDQSPRLLRFFSEFTEILSSIEEGSIMRLVIILSLRY
ncbi:MAG: hypothetical protein C0619_03530 [Desulfuromonas sp.]|nr:MAG: hypothetical protein C0619_03530 [Desulfuromonas sp.]